MPKLTKDEYTIDEAKAAIAQVLKDKVAAHSTQLQKLREREVRRAPMAKGELCLLCAQLPKACNCLKKATAEEANREMGGFRSIASSPTFGGGKLTNAPKPQTRSGNGNRATAGVIPNAKAETAPTIAPRQAAEMRPMPGAKLPDDAKSKVAPGGEGSGGDIEKRDMAAGAPAPAARPVVGVGGKQPVGQGGGDAHKVPHPAPAAGADPTSSTAAGLADVKSMAPNAPHPATSAGLHNVQALAPKAAWSGAGLPKLKAALAGVKAAKTAPAAAPAGAPPAAAPPLASARPAPAPPPAISPVHDKAQIAADKRAGGVGFLNNLISRFSRNKPAASMPTPGMEPARQGGGPVQSQRFHGARPLQRSEKGPFALDKCAMCTKSEHAGLCKDAMGYGGGEGDSGVPSVAG
jgi:hypothetical protein